MNKTQELFLQCLKDHLKGKKTEITDGFEPEELVSYAKTHEVSGIIYHQLKAGFSDERLKKDYLYTLYSFVNKKKCFNKVSEALRQNGIFFAALKGSVIAPLYPEEPLRTMGDIDLVIREDDKPELVRIMTELGFKADKSDTEHTLDFKNAVCEFEMHPFLIYPYESVEKKEYADFFNRFEEYVEADGTLKKEFHLMFLFVHLRKHLLNHGAGFRMFLDIAVFTEAYRDILDFEWLSENLKKLSLLDFAEIAYTYIERWFDVASPFALREIGDEAYEKSAEIIFAGGVFGFGSDANAASTLDFDIARYGKVLGKLKHKLWVAFPPASVMLETGRYDYLKKHRYLLPVAWGTRLTRPLLRKSKKGAKVKSSGGEKVDMIKDWGLS